MRVLFVIFFAAMFGGEAMAQSCNSLRAQLSAAQSGGASLGQLQAQYAGYGCNLPTRWGRNRRCSRIEAQMRAGGSGVDSGRVRVLQQQVSVACAAPSRQVRQNAADQSRTAGGRIIFGTRPDNSYQGDRGGGGLFSGLFGRRRERVIEDLPVQTVRVDPSEARRVERINIDEDRRRRDARQNDGPREVDVTLGGSGRSLREGSTRTVCVRLCDGFYFPINSRSHSDNFYEELAMCVGRCPGADVSLYYHGADSPVESMRSTLTGERYVNLPTAFAYRKAASESCGCQTRSVVAGDLDADKTLGYVGTEATDAPVTAAAVATAAAGGTSAWKPLRAVYDETGKPLAPSLTDRSLVEKKARSHVPVEAASLEAVTPNRGLPSTGDEPLRVREVRPQFYSGGGLGQEVERVKFRPTVTTTAVTVVPLSPDASELPRHAEPVDEVSAMPVNLLPDTTVATNLRPRG